MLCNNIIIPFCLETIDFLFSFCFYWPQYLFLFQYALSENATLEKDVKNKSAYIQTLKGNCQIFVSLLLLTVASGG